MNIKLGWFLLVTMDVITVGNFSRSTFNDLLSNILAVAGFTFELGAVFPHFTLPGNFFLSLGAGRTGDSLA